MKKQAYELFALLLLLNPVYALNDINISIDSPLEMCLTSDLTNHTCAKDKYLVLDGTKDHFLYLTPEQTITENRTETVYNIVDNPIRFITSGTILFLMFIMIAILPFLMRWLNGR